ncbi:MAG: GNAT family N-acetyltransferase [Verrucomicrobiaceae bacterium]
MSTFSVRPYRLEDVEEIFEAAEESREHVAPWMDWLTPDYAMEDARTWVEFAVKSREDRTGYFFVVVDDADGAVVGSCGLNLINWKDRYCNLGYWVRKTSLGKGAARQATLHLRDFGFGELGMNRLEIVVGDGNGASRGVAEAVGAAYEGLLKKRITIWGKGHDAHMYALVRGD